MFLNFGAGLKKMRVAVPDSVRDLLLSTEKGKLFWVGRSTSWAAITRILGIPRRNVYLDDHSLLRAIGATPSRENRDNAKEIFAEEGMIVSSWSSGYDIGMFSDVLLPHIRDAESVSDLFGKSVALYGRRARATETIREAIQRVLRVGVVNGTYVDEQELKMLFKFLFFQAGPRVQAHALNSWADRRVFVDEEGNVRVKDTSTFAWMMAPLSQYGLESEMTQYVHEQRVAIGDVFAEGYLGNMTFVKAPASDSGFACHVLSSHGYVPSIHQKANRVWVDWAAGIDEGRVFSIFGDLKKPGKSPARLQLLTGTCAFPDGDITPSSLVLRSGNSAIPLTSGRLFKKVAISNMIGYYGSGVLPIKDTVTVRDRRTEHVQMREDSLIKARPSSHVGKIVKHGEVIFSDLINRRGYPVEILDIRWKTDNGVCDVSIVVDIIVKSKSPKFRGPGIKGSGMVTSDKRLFESLGADVVFGQETVKQAHIALMCMWAESTGRTVEVTKFGLSPNDATEFAKWLVDNKKEKTISFVVSDRSLPFYEAAAKSGRLQMNGKVATQVVEYYVGNMILGIEAPVTELRMTNSAVTPHMLIDACYRKGIVPTVPGVSVEEVDLDKVGVLDVKAARDISSRSWRDAIRRGAELFPHGMLFEYLAGEEVVDAYVDWNAIAWISTGDLVPSDPVSLSLLEALTAKSALIPQAETDEDHSKNDENLETMSNACERYLMGLRSIVLSPQTLKRIMRPTRSISVMLTVRMTDLSNGPVDEAWVSSRTFAFMSRGNPDMRSGDSIVLNRYPSPLSAGLPLRVNDTVPDGCVLLPTFWQQVANEGDGDGDQDVITDEHLFHVGLLMNSEDRKRVKALLEVLLNNGLDIPEFNFEQEKVDGEWVAPTFTVPEEERLLNRYLAFQTLEESEMVNWLMQKPLWSPGENVNRSMSNNTLLEEYLEMADRISSFATFGIGGIFAVADAAMVLSSVWYGVDSVKHDTARAVAVAAFKIYEAVFLSGNPTPTAWEFWVNFQSPKEDKFADFCLAMVGIGVDPDIELPDGSTLGRSLFQVRLFTLAYGNMLRGAEPRADWLDSLGWWGEHNQLQLIAFTRNAFSGSIGMRRESESMIPEDMVLEGMRYVQPQSMFYKLFGELIRTVALPMLSLTRDVVASQEE